MAGPTTESQNYEFKAEVKQLLDILIHSVYTSKDIFIRELVSNAADALEKARFLKVQGREMPDSDAELEIHIETADAAKKDKDEDEEKDGESGTSDEAASSDDERDESDDGPKTLVISDTGIGMSEEEIRTNLGTIAHSGATAFLEQLKALKKDAKDDAKDAKDDAKKDDLSLIGRFGVGFYSVFMVADKVTVRSRSADPAATPVVWTSDGLGSYSVEPAAGDVPRGTRIEIQLKKDEERFAEASTITGAIRKYSNFVPFPIKVNGGAVNQTTALWREPPHQVKDEQYSEFHKFITHDFDDPLLHLHMSVDVPLQFSALLFVPKMNTETMGFGEREVSLQLYVKRVLIDGENKNLLPTYLRFVKGVVESEDLPLNVSRETLQENPLVVKIRDTLTKKLLKQFRDLGEKNAEEYNTFWNTFGRILKEGHADFAHRELLHELFRFNSSVHDDDKGLTSLTEYVERMPESQPAIYYLSGASREALERDPRLELFRKKGVEVLYLSDLADEFVLSSVGTYKEKRLVSADQVSPDDLKGSDDKSDDKKDDEDKKDEVKDFEVLVKRFKEVLGDKVTDVKKSERLVDSPACLVGEEGMSGHMDKMIRLMNKDATLPKKTLELNPGHSLMRNLLSVIKKEENDPFINRACEQIFEGAMLVDGYLNDPHQLVERMHEIMDEAAGLKAK